VTARKANGNERAMSKQEARFLERYLADPKRNATKAAMAAGYSEKSARYQARDLLKRPHIAPHVREADRKAEAAVARVVERTALTKERALELLAAIAQRDIRRIVSFGPDKRKLLDKHGVVHETSGVELRPSDELDFLDAMCIDEISEGPSGIKVKLTSSRAALMDFAKLAGWIVEKREDRNPALEAMLDVIRGAVSRSSAFPVGDAARRARTIEHQTVADAAAFLQKEKD
jgi:phage terminase small subunit